MGLATQVWSGTLQNAQVLLDLGSILGGTPHPVVLAPRDSGNCIRALVYSYFTTVTARGPPRLNHALNRLGVSLGCLEALYPKIKIPKDPQKDRPPNPKP